MSQTTPWHHTTLSVPDSHPALPGHFPGRPLVPGVVLLEAVLAAAENWLGRALHISGLPQVKFLAPLLPQQPVQLELRLEAAQLRFNVRHDAQPLAQGTFTLLSLRS